MNLFKVSQKKGLAPIELLINIALIVLLASCTIPYHRFMQKKIHLKVARREILILKAAVNSYFVNKNPNAYPPPTEHLCAEYLLGADPQVVKNIFYDPQSKKKREYRYTASPDGQHYCIWTVGLNGVSETDGITNRGRVLQNNKSDDVFATRTIDPLVK